MLTIRTLTLVASLCKVGQEPTLNRQFGCVLVIIIVAMNFVAMVKGFMCVRRERVSESVVSGCAHVVTGSVGVLYLACGYHYVAVKLEMVEHQLLISATQVNSNKITRIGCIDEAPVNKK